MSQTFQPPDIRRFETALRRFDEENSRDPSRVQTDGFEQPRELCYAKWLSDWVLRLAPEASEALRLAARCQHICRWSVPREAYPMNRAGYLKWREDLKKFHAQKSGEILREAGYPDQTVVRVQALNLKQGFPHDPEVRVLEDALCLVFLEHQLSELAEKTSEEQLLNALRKSWGKMTSRAQQIALSLPFAPRQKALLERALSSRA